jgi:hypothetical protein
VKREQPGVREESVGPAHLIGKTAAEAGTLFLSAQERTQPSPYQSCRYFVRFLMRASLAEQRGWKRLLAILTALRALATVLRIGARKPICRNAPATVSVKSAPFAPRRRAQANMS